MKLFNKPSLMCFPAALHEENISRMLQKHLKPVFLSQTGDFTPWAGQGLVSLHGIQLRKIFGEQNRHQSQCLENREEGKDRKKKERKQAE